MRARRVSLALGVALLAATGGAVLVPLVRSAASEPVPSTSTLHLFTCVHAGDRYCERIGDDLARRDPLSDSDRKAAGPFEERLRRAFIEGLGADCGQVPRLCVFPEPPAAEQVRRALVDGGFEGAVVRPARYTDPAPADAIVYAVRAGYGCLVGWIEENSGSSPQTVGRHDDGTCLPP